MKCRNCNKSLTKVVELGTQPLSGIFLAKKENNLKKYSLDLYNCKSCNLIQLGKSPPAQKMYGKDYNYKTSMSKLMVTHLQKKYKKILSYRLIKNFSNILDIGSNDGTFINFFTKNEKKLNLFAIDPSAEKFKNLYNKKVNLITKFFSKSQLDKYFNKINLRRSKFKLITSFAMFYDLDDPNSFCRDINNSLDDNGLWITELSYFPLLLKNLTYDQICHEHVCYYTLNTFNQIIKKNGLKIIDIEFNEINGGSIEIICSKINSKHKVNYKKISGVLKDEKNITMESYKKFNSRINNVKNTLNLFFENINKKNIIGYGASTKGNVVLNHCKIDFNNLSFICDGNPSKINKYTPGSNIKIITKEKMRKYNPKYLLVLIWSFRSEIIKQEMNYIKKGGKLIFHLPLFHVVDKSNYKKYLKENFKTFSFNY